MRVLIEKFLFLAVVAVALGSITPAGASDTTTLAQAAVGPAACALLDDADQRATMDALLVKLLVACGREHELGTPGAEAAEALPTKALATDVPVNDPTGEEGFSHVQSETSIARSETTGTICSGYNDSYHFHAEDNGFTGFSRSTDGGQTFDDRGALGANSFGDPSLVWRRLDGNFYFSALASGGLGIWRSIDDCQTFQFLGNSHASALDDKEFLAVDNNPTSPYYGRLHVVWKDFGALGRLFANHSDNGVSWSSAVQLTTTANVQSPWPAVASNGDLYVAWLRWVDFRFGPIDIEVARSIDGGATFSQVTSPMTGRDLPRDNAASTTCSRPALNGNIRLLASPQIAVAANGALHVVYVYDPDGLDNGDVVNVYYRKSTNGGATWAPEVRLNDDATTNDQWFPTLSTGQGGMTVVSTWYDRRLDPGNLLFDTYQRSSFDGGDTWEPSVRLSDVSSPVHIDSGTAACYHGDYDQQIQAGEDALVQWADDRNIQDGHPDPDVWFEKVAVVPASQDPVAEDDWFLTLWETPVKVPFETLLANDVDPDGDPIEVCATGDPQYGTVTPDGKTSVTYTPPDGCAVGLDSVPYTVCDKPGGSDTATVWISIGGIICPDGNEQ